MMNLDCYESNNRPSTIRQLVTELQKFPPDTHVRTLCDHALGSIIRDGEQVALHRVHLDIDFDYISEIR